MAGFACALATSVGLADLLLPLECLMSLGYILVVCLAVRSTSRHALVNTAAGCTTLLLLGWVLAWPASLTWLHMTNRALVLVMLWATVYGLRLQQRGEAALYQARGTFARQAAVPESCPRVPQENKRKAPRTDAAMRHQRDWLDVALNSLGEAVITANTHLTVTFCNQAAENLTGWQAADACGLPLKTVLRLLDEPTRQPVAINFQQVVQDNTVIGLGEQTLLLRSDGYARAIDGCATPIRDEQGRTQGMVLVMRDITAPRRLETQLRQSQKLAAIGTLAGGIAHEFNNLLAAIIGFTELTIEDLPATSPSSRNLQKVLQAGLRAKQIVQQLVAFSRQSQPVREAVQLDQSVREALALLRASLPSTITLNYTGKPVGGQSLPTRRRCSRWSCTWWRMPAMPCASPVAVSM